MDKTAFFTHKRLYCYMRLFGQKKYLNNVSVDVHHIGFIQVATSAASFDDVIIFLKSLEEHLQHLAFALQLLQKAGMTLKLVKYFFFSNAADHLAIVITLGRLHIVAKTTDAVHSLYSPTKTSKLRSFLGLCSPYRRFVPNIARVTTPLNMRLKKSEPKQIKLYGKKPKAVHDYKLK